MDFFMAKQILQFESIKSNQAFAAKMKHNYRIGEVKNADPTRLKDNRSIIDLPPNATYNSFFEMKINECPYYNTHKIRKNAVLGYEIMMSYGLKDLPKDFSIDRWAEVSKEWLISEFGRENIASAVLHMDEGTPHIHAVVIPIADGRLQATSYYIPDRTAMRDMHRRYHEYTKEVGLEAEASHKIISHEKVSKFYNNIDMALEKELPGPEEGEELTDYVQRANEFYKTQMLRSLGKDHQISELKRNNEALERANQYIMSEIGSLEKAKHAIEYQDGLEKAFRYVLETDPERAEQFMQELKDIKQEYENSLETQERETE